VGEPKVAAPLDHRDVVRPAGEAARGGGAMRGLRVMPELPFALKPEPSVEGRNQNNLCSSAPTGPPPPPVLHLSSPSASTPPRHRILGPKVSTAFPSSLWSLAFVPSREKRAKPVVSSVPFLDRCPAPRRRADPPSSESRPSSRAGRFAGAATVVAVRAALPCDCAVPLFRRVLPSFGLPPAPTR
jgi:hypothetical protein